MGRRDAMVLGGSLLGMMLLSILIAVLFREEVVYWTYPDMEVPVRAPTRYPSPAAVVATEETPTPAPRVQANGTPLPDPLILPPPTRPPDRPFVPGSGPYRLYPAPSTPPPGQDWLLFDYDDQAIAHLSTGARVAAFCYFRDVTPTPVPGGYAGSAYRGGPDGGLFFVPLYYIDERNAVHIVARIPPEMDDRLLADVIPFLNTRDFDPVAYCAEESR
ncbi:hypothetical protein [Thermoflexus sp.]|uniref:hypothetical protein n=1 Tax=Thermoflexus sp. TaxID=1969742 RepID=UPI002ADDFA01|nr:hypothetical protein [Thermoflexus sp.]